MSKRGRGTCLTCRQQYANKYKPEYCQCGSYLGGKYVPSVSAAKKAKSVPIPDAVEVITNVFSTKTSTRNDRCLVIKEGSIWICLHSNCLKNRATFVSAGNDEGFACKHINHVKCGNVPKPLDIWTPTAIQIDSYQAGEVVKTELRNVIGGLNPNSQAVVTVCEDIFVVYGPPTATNTMGYCHVKKEETNLFCASKDCKGIVAKCKSGKQKEICVHLHLLLLYKKSIQKVFSYPENEPGHEPSELSETSGQSDPPPRHPNEPTTDTTGPSSSNNPSSQSNHPQPVPAQEPLDLSESSVSRKATIKLISKKTLPYEIPKETLSTIDKLDAITLLGDPTQTGWPLEFKPEEGNCECCGSELGTLRCHPGSKGENKGKAYLITRMHPFRIVAMHVRFCIGCKAMHQADTLKIGLFNISDKVLVSINILMEWREQFKRGNPISNVIDATVSFLTLKAESLLSQGELRYVKELLYNGFYAFEAITPRDLNSVICGICGIAGEVYLGDGNEKNCCNSKHVKFPKENGQIAQRTLEEMLEDLKLYWLEKTTYTRVLAEPEFNAATLPPVIAPALRADVVTNTEAEKKSVFLSKQANGDQAALHNLIKTEQIEIKRLQDYSKEQLVYFCKECKIPYSGKSQAKMKSDIHSLYEGMLYGFCPCHGYNKKEGKTGGFYHMVCRHGCTVASKTLILSESVRDAADLYISVKHKPIVLINDSPCGFVRHLECRDPELAKKLWGEFSGCFERPGYAKPISSGHNFPEVVPAEYKRSNQCVHPLGQTDELIHPFTGTSRRFVLQDRFHASSKPHKSPLCLFHDINLCQQANCITTSTQESENARKNQQRLRSTCAQNFGLHFLFNYIMDFYQNEAIVRAQKESLKVHLKPGQKIERDNFQRFSIVD